MNGMSVKEAMGVLIAHKYFQVTVKGDCIHIYKIVDGKTVTAVLEKVADGFMLRPTKYAFKSLNSFLDFSEQEERVTRRYTTITVFIKRLKESGVWKHVINKGCIKVNPNNKRLLLKATSDIRQRLFTEVRQLTE